MRRLRDFQPVLLQAGDEGVPCRVVARQELDAVLLPDDAALPELAPGSQRAMLSFERDGHPALLHGLVDHGPLAGTLRFTVVDATSRPEPRRSPRMPLDVPAMVKAGTSPRPAAARTVDIGRGGVLLQGWTAPEGTTVCVLLGLPGAEGRLRLEGRVVRAEPGRAAVAFHTEAHELADFVLRCRGVLAEQLAERSARRAAALAGR